MSKQDPHVQVFHFTSKISNAKIKKYQTATSRGMSNPDSRSNLTPPSDNSLGPMASTSGDPPQPSPDLDAPSLSGQHTPPRKRLKLHVRQPGQPPNAHLLAQSSRSKPSDPSAPTKKTTSETPSALRSEMFDKPMSRHSSELPSSGSSADADESRPKSKSKNKEYGDFMSYYILDNEDEDGGGDVPIPAPSMRPTHSLQKHNAKPQPSPQAQVDQSVPVTSQPAAKASSSKRKRDSREPAAVGQQSHSPHLFTNPPAVHPPPPPTLPPISIPRVILIDLDQDPKPPGPGQRETVRSMINKLQALSEALAPFAGMDGLPKNMPTPPVDKKRTTSQSQKNLIDGFLDMFETASTDDEPDDIDHMDAPLESFIDQLGTPDHALIYGIQFIMNALRSWAHQRLQVQFNKQFIEATQKQHAERLMYQPEPKRGPGRPRKSSATQLAEEQAAEAPSDVHMSLDNTPEGRAVRAFQAVLHCGCLRINCVLPAPLTLALTHIYMQIDRLINHGTKEDAVWQPMSYLCQIRANQTIVQKWKEDQARALEESARQQQLNDQNIMAQMRMPSQPYPHLRGGPSHSIGMPQPLQTPQPEYDSSRRSSLATQALTQSTPGLGMPVPGPIYRPNALVSSVPRPNSPQVNVHGHGEPAGKPSSNASTAAEKRRALNATQAMSNIKMYMPGWLPRSGAQMKFSFSPTNQQTPSSFATSQASPRQAQSSAMPPSVAQSEEDSIPGPVAPRAYSSPVGEEIVVAVAAHRSSKNATLAQGRAGGQRTPSNRERSSMTPSSEGAGPHHSGLMAGGQHSASVSASPALGSTSATVSRMSNSGPAVDMARRFPHPGAVIVDQ